ncbi:MAG: thiolase domain-containing protein [Candidatus Thermoplasmatota archaeon]
MREVAIIGVGDTKFGELWDRSFREIGIEAGLSAIENANITANDIDAIYVGNMSAGKFISQENIGALIADYAGLTSSNIPPVRIEAAGASGGLALHQGYIAVASGIYDIVVVGGAEKMTDVGEKESLEILSTAGDQEWESVFGVTFAGLHALIARRHMHEYGTKREQMAMVAVKAHKNGSLNPKAHYQNEIKLESVLNSTMVAEPLTTMDCAPVSDGAAAVVLCPMEKAKKYTDTPIKIAGAGVASDTLALHDRRDICTLDATVFASKKAYKLAGIEPKDIDLAEVHDSFTISEIVGIEDLGFVKKGEGGKATEEGLTALNSKFSINPSGGLKARGQPIGAIGVAQAVEIVRQLRGEAGKRQVSGAEIGLSQNVAGTGGTVVVHIFRR